jgi:hypothetical protein
MNTKRLCSAIVVTAALAIGVAIVPAGAATAGVYSAFRQESPRSILIVPVLNNTVNVNAPDFFLSTVSRPFADRGYYVFPTHMVKRVLEDDGLADPGLVHGADPRRLGGLFGCDAVLYVSIEEWTSKYIVLATSTQVSFKYTIKSCKTGQTLWTDTESRVYSPQNNNSSGNLLADLLAQALVAALEKGMPNYMPLTIEANAAAAGGRGRGIPAGPYLPAMYLKDEKLYPTAQ